jgi:hypothetical protein
MEKQIIHHPSEKFIIIKPSHPTCLSNGCDMKHEDIVIDGSVDGIKSKCKRCGARITTLSPWDEVISN